MGVHMQRWFTYIGLNVYSNDFCLQPIWMAKLASNTIEFTQWIVIRLDVEMVERIVWKDLLS